ncbi:MAG: transposase [Candidatus Omnitrophica bacterium]|nr:transposase [Candidatus Omnitrophota bacterium]
MARLPRIALPDLAYHITQRGNRRQAVFWTEADRQLYLTLLRDQAREHPLAETHRRYTRAINFREGWRGYLWQGRFGSVALDEQHLVAAVRYVERNPVAAGLVHRAEQYPWSSARAHVTGMADPLLTPNFLTTQIRNWAAFLADEADDTLGTTLSRHATVGRPLGSAAFLERLEAQVGWSLQPRRPGRPRHVK